MQISAFKPLPQVSSICRSPSEPFSNMRCDPSKTLWVHGPLGRFCPGLRSRHLVFLRCKVSAGADRFRLNDVCLVLGQAALLTAREACEDCPSLLVFSTSRCLAGGGNGKIEYRPSRHKSRLSQISARSDTASAPHSVTNSLGPGYPREHISQPHYLLPTPDICICARHLHRSSQAIVLQALVILEIIAALWTNSVAQRAGSTRALFRFDPQFKAMETLVL